MSDIFKELGFEDLEAGDVQSVDEMTIVPLIGTNRTENVAQPQNLRFRSTSSYGSMEWGNEDPDGDAIVPSNTMVISEKAAQDHAMAGTGVIKPLTATTFDNACCVQESQGGYLAEAGNAFDILPLELRKVLVNPTLRGKRDYGKLWPFIKRFLEGVPGCAQTGGDRGHLEDFFRPYRKQMEEFAAEFEPVDDQVGALIFFGETPVGFEVMPTVAHWEFYWKWLIRGCYGAQVLKLRLLDMISPNRIELQFPSSINDMGSVISDYLRMIAIAMRTAVAELALTGRAEAKQLAEGSPMLGTILRTERGGGDLIVQENKPVYLSLVL